MKINASSVKSPTPGAERRPLEASDLTVAGGSTAMLIAGFIPWISSDLDIQQPGSAYLFALFGLFTLVTAFTRRMPRTTLGLSIASVALVAVQSALIHGGVARSEYGTVVVEQDLGPGIIVAAVASAATLALLIRRRARDRTVSLAEVTSHSSTVRPSFVAKRLRGTRTFASLLIAGAAAGLALMSSQAVALSGPNAGVALVAAPGGNGYAVISASGGQYNYGGSAFTGSMAGTPLNAPIVGAASVPGSDAKWFVAADGGVFTQGAVFYGSMAGVRLNRPIVAIVASATGNGYLLVAADGGTFAFGDFPFPGSLAGTPLNAPIVAAARTPDNRGVWLFASDGGVFTLGTAGFYGSLGSVRLNKPIVTGIASPSGRGYILIAADGGTFNFGDYPFPGSLADVPLNAPIVAAAPYGGTTGLWLLGADGGVFTLNAPFYGSAAGEANTPPVPVGSPATGTNGGLVTVACPAGGSITVSAAIGNQLTSLLAAARSQGIILCGSGWRSSASQIALRKKNCGTSNYAIYQMPSSSCSPQTAIPGTSMHERGLAIDFNGIAWGNAKSNWLQANASRFGLYVLANRTEAWHYSINGK